jgi:hypothetical protein
MAYETELQLNLTQIDGDCFIRVRDVQGMLLALGRMTFANDPRFQKQFREVVKALGQSLKDVVDTLPDEPEPPRKGRGGKA